MARNYRRQFRSATAAANLQIRLYDDAGVEVNNWNFARDRFSIADTRTGYVRVWCGDVPEDISFWLEIQKVSDSSVVYSEYLDTVSVSLTSESRTELTGYLQGHPILGERRVLIQPSALGYPSYPWALNGQGPNLSPMVFYRDYDGFGTAATNGGNGAIFLSTSVNLPFPGTKIFDKSTGSNGLNIQLQNYVAMRLGNGQTVLLWTYYSPTDPSSNTVILRSVSADNGTTWSTPTLPTLPNEYSAFGFINAPYWGGKFAGDVNTLYMTVYGYILNSGNNGSRQALWKSVDNGVNWIHVSYISQPAGSNGLEELYLVQFPNGRILAVGGGEIHNLGCGIGYSDDLGITWRDAAGNAVTSLTQWNHYPMTNPRIIVLSATRAAVFGRIGVSETYPHTKWGVGYFVVDNAGTPVTPIKIFEPAGYYFDCGYVTFAQQPYDSTYKAIYYTDLFRNGLGGAFGKPGLAQREFDFLPPSAASSLTSTDIANAVVAAMATAPVGSIAGTVPDATAANQATIITNLAAVKADTARALGLAQDNTVLDDTTYDVDGNLTAAALYGYDTAAHAAAHVAGSGGGVGLIYKWALSATITAGNLTLAKQTRIA